jgi:hypothetical protein
MLDLGRVRAPRGAPTRAVAWPVGLQRVEVHGALPARRPDPFLHFLLDAAQAGPVDVNALARLSGLPVPFLQGRLDQAVSRRWIDPRGRLTEAGRQERLEEPPIGSVGGWMVLCRRTGRVLPALLEVYPRSSRSADEPLRLPPQEGLGDDPVRRQLGLDRAWRDHRRRVEARDERQELHGTDLEPSGEPEGEVELESGPTPERKPEGVRGLGRPQWVEARVDLWVEVDVRLPVEDALTLRAGCPVGWQRDGDRYLRLLEQTEEGKALIAALLEEGRALHRERMSEALDHRWQERLVAAQAEARAGLLGLPRAIDNELSELVKARVRATLGTDRMKNALGLCRHVAEQLLLALLDDEALIEEARAAWSAGPAPTARDRGAELRARLERWAPAEGDDGEGLLPAELKVEVDGWAKRPPFKEAPTHGVKLLLHPFLLASLAPENPAARRLRAAVARDGALLRHLREVIKQANPAHHASTREEREAEQRAQLEAAWDRLRLALVACFPADAGGASTAAGEGRAREPLQPGQYDQHSF